MSADEVVPSVQVGPRRKLRVNMAHGDYVRKRVKYSASAHAISRNKCGALVDRGANGGIVGNDAHVIYTHLREVDVTGIDNHELNALKIVDASAKVNTHI